MRCRWRNLTWSGIITLSAVLCAIDLYRHAKQPSGYGAEVEDSHSIAKHWFHWDGDKIETRATGHLSLGQCSVQTNTDGRGSHLLRRPESRGVLGSSCLEGRFLCTSAISAIVCCELCGLELNCKAWTFVIADGECWLQGCALYTRRVNKVVRLSVCWSLCVRRSDPAGGDGLASGLGTTTDWPWNDPCCIAGSRPTKWRVALSLSL